MTNNDRTIGTGPSSIQRDGLVMLNGSLPAETHRMVDFCDLHNDAVGLLRTHKELLPLRHRVVEVDHLQAYMRSLQSMLKK